MFGIYCGVDALGRLWPGCFASRRTAQAACGERGRRFGRPRHVLEAVSRPLRRHGEESRRVREARLFARSQGHFVRHLGQSREGGVAGSGDEGRRPGPPLRRYGDVCDKLHFCAVCARTEVSDRPCCASARFAPRLRACDNLQAALQRRSLLRAGIHRRCHPLRASRRRCRDRQAGGRCESRRGDPPMVRGRACPPRLAPRAYRAYGTRP